MELYSASNADTQVSSRAFRGIDFRQSATRFTQGPNDLFQIRYSFLIRHNSFKSFGAPANAAF
jgi:hypothetical protein